MNVSGGCEGLAGLLPAGVADGECGGTSALGVSGDGVFLPKMEKATIFFKPLQSAVL